MKLSLFNCQKISARLVFILLLGGVLILAAYLPQEKQLAPREKPVIDLICRALQPGETVMVLLRGVTDIRQAEIKFLNQKYHLLPHPKAHQWFGLLGLDYRLKPGEYPLRAVIVDSQGNRQEVWLSLRVKPKSFPVKKLWVAPRYVTPPPEERERIRRESTLLQTIFSLETPSWLGQGRFILPCQGKVYLNFGEKRIYNNQPRSSHSGIDIAAVTGTPVVASNAGRVVLASNLYFAGKTVIIDHGLGLYTFYAHLAEIKVVRGDFVRQGQIIGLVGATGRVTGPHLHWSARLKGSRVDPMSLLEIPLGE